MEIGFRKNERTCSCHNTDASTKNVLMLGFMNKEAYDKTVETKRVTFYSRSRKPSVIKGETSETFLIS